MKPRDPRTLAIVSSTALVLVVGLLTVQHLRHGWPFSLPTGMGAAPTQAPAPARAVASAPAHPRAEVTLAERQLEALGVRIEEVQQESTSQAIRAVATIVPDESRLSHIHTRVAGWIERLHVNTTGERVRAGQPLAGIFSQELLSSQTEYLSARRSAQGGPRSVVLVGARSRLQVLGMTDAEIRAIEEAGEPRRLVTVTAPRTGIVLHRGISVGTAVDPSTELMTVADLSRVWIFAEIPEADIPSVRIGTPAELEFPASGAPPFEARVEFLYPTLSERTRTLRVRFAVDNPEGSLRPGLYGTATFRVEPRVALTVPRDAVVDTGRTQHVFAALGEGRFAPREVKLGGRFGDRVEVREGLAAGDAIVASGVFLIDSESRLRASGGGTGHAHGSKPSEPSGAEHAGHAAPDEGQRPSAAGSGEGQAEPPTKNTHEGH